MGVEISLSDHRVASDQRSRSVISHPMQPTVSQTTLDLEDSLYIEVDLRPPSAHQESIVPSSRNPEEEGSSKAFRCPINRTKELWASITTEGRIPNELRKLVLADLIEAWHFSRVNNFHANIR